jgi:hypothetical protein
VDSPPPISRVLPLAVTIGSAILSVITSIPRTARNSFAVLSAFSTPVLAVLFTLTPLLWILLYLISPLVAFLELVLDLFVSKPYAVAVYVFNLLSPAYIFCGVAVIIGCLIGIAGRVLSLTLIGWFLVWTEPTRREMKKRVL